MAIINGTSNADVLTGTSGNDAINGGAGNDKIVDLFGDNVIDAGAGSDTVLAGVGDDLLIHKFGENVGARDVYDGGLGQDTLRLVFTSAEWARADVQADIAAFLAYQTKCLNRLLNPLGFSTPFTFKSTNLTVNNIEKLEVMVEGVLLDPRNEAVTAVNDTLKITEDAAGSVNLLANDLVPDRAASVTLLNAGRYGVASVAPSLNGAVQSAAFTYAPSAAAQSLRAGEVVTDTISYKVVDVNGDASTASVTVTITGVNDAATISGVAAGSVTEDKTLATSGKLTVSDVDTGENQALAQTGTVGRYGSFSVDATGAWNYALNNASAAVQALGQGLTATDTFTVVSKDGTARQVVTVTVNGANDAPVVSGPVKGMATEDGAVVKLSALANASDVDAGTTLSVVGVPATLPAGVTYDAATKSFTLNPANAAYQSLAQGVTTTVSVSYGVSDGVVTTPASASWTITGANDAPIVTGAVKGLATEDGAAVRLSALANASDVDAGTTLAVVNLPTTLPAGVTYDAATKSFTLNPSNAAYQSLAQGATRTVSVSYGVSDGIATTPASVCWTVTGTNDAPVVSGAVKGSATEDGAVVRLSALANASDVDAGTTLAVVNVPTALPAGVTYDASTRSFTLDPSNAAYQSLAQGATRTVSVAYGVSDGIATTPASVCWTVTGTNDAPVATPSSASTDEDMVLTGSVSATDVDAGATLTYALVSGPSHGSVTINSDGTYSYRPTGDYSGADSFTFKANDGLADSAPATVSLNVRPVTDTPTLTTGAAASGQQETAIPLAIAAAQTDSDGSETVSVTITGVPADAALSAGVRNLDGSYTLTTADLGGLTLTAGTPGALDLTVTVTARDGAAAPVSVSGHVAVTVSPALVVTTLEDVVDATDGKTSLREAIANANAKAGADTITFADGLTGTIHLGSVLINTDAVTIQAALDPDGSQAITVSGDGAVGIFETSKDFTVDGLKLTGGNARGPGGAINGSTRQDGSRLDAAVTVRNSVISDNRSGIGGGGVAAAQATIVNSTISGNSARGSGGGVSAGVVSISGSTISGNSADFNGGGVSGTVTIVDSTISGNSNRGRGGGVEGVGTIVNSTISGNLAQLGGGVSGAFTIDGSTISGNTANSGGGGAEGRNTLNGSTVSGNSAMRGGGLVGEVTLNDSTVSGNTAEQRGGAIAGNATLTNSTVSGNSSGGIVGGIYGNATLVNSTISGNSSGIYNEFNGGAVSGSASLTNSIVMGNTGASGAPEISGAVTQSGANIVGTTVTLADGTTSTTTAAQVFASVDASGGGQLASNGGPVQTIALNASSLNPAIDASVGSTATTDARGVGAVDIPNVGATGAGAAVRDLGAFEVQAVPREADSLVVTTLSDRVDAFDGLTSLREALAYANGKTGADTITFADGLDGTIHLGSVLSNTDAVTIQAALGADGKQAITVSGDGAVGIFETTTDFTVDGLKLTGGNARSPARSTDVTSGAPFWRPPSPSATRSSATIMAESSAAAAGFPAGPSRSSTRR